LGKGRGGVKWDSGGARKVRREERKNVAGREMECTKIAKKRNIFGIWRCPWVLPPRVIMFRKLFAQAKFALQILSSILNPLNKTSKFTIL